MEIVKGYHRDGTLAVEYITLPDGSLVTKSYDKSGKLVVAKKKNAKDGSLLEISKYNKQGQWVVVKYDEKGNKSIGQVKSDDEFREFVKSAELLSKKGSKRRLSSIQKQRGE